MFSPFTSSSLCSTLCLIMHVCLHLSFQSVDPAMLLHTHVPPLVSFFLLPDVSQGGRYPFILLLDRFCKLLSSEYFQLSHFFRVHSIGFSPQHQIFIVGKMGEAGSSHAPHSSNNLKAPQIPLCIVSLTPPPMYCNILTYIYLHIVKTLIY